MNLDKLYSNIKSVDLWDIAADIIENDLSDFIADLNRSQMADKGQRSDGSLLKPDYTYLTKDIKSDKSGTSGIIEHVTLYDTGELHKSIFASLPQKSLILDSEDWKVEDLTEKYGEFLGLTDESILQLKERFEPLLLERMYEQLLR
jgi:hypothetical protein